MMKKYLGSVISMGCLVAVVVTSLPAAEIYVHPSGNDTQAGSKAAPMRSLAAARDAVRKVAGKEAVTIHVADGIYYLPETLMLTPQDSGSAQHPVIYQSEHEGKAVISGGATLAVVWKPYKDGIYQAITPAGMKIDQLFIGGTRQRMARYPNADEIQTTAAYQGFAADAFSKERAARWSDPSGGYIHAMHAAEWGGYHYRITGKNADGTIAYEGGWQNNRQMGMHKNFRMVENIFEELDAPGEWFHNATTNTLYFQPEPGMDLTKVSVEVVRLRHLVEFQGTLAAPVRFVTFSGFTYRHAARTFIDTKEPLLRSDWTIYRGGAVLLTGTENVTILDSEFDQVGGNAIFVNYYNRSTYISGCHIHDAGASGICFVGDPQAVRDPLFEYGKSQDLSKIDLTPGPKTENYPAECIVDDCLIHGIGRVERQPAGVQISMAMGITVRDCSIYDCARAGINISEGTWGGHLIDRCDVFDTVLETGDHGSFNSWGRDRFWSSNHRGTSQPAVNQNPQLPFLDVIKTNIIRNSRWRCDHGWDIDLDDGSSNYEIYNNLLLHGGLKFREGFRRKAYNNVIINNGFHPHVWFENSGDEFTRNLVMRGHADIGMPANWGGGVDKNLFESQASLDKGKKAGCDGNSIVGDAMFVDPAAGNFQAKENSPALQIGFKNFPMDQFGVKKAPLKAIAKTPEIPSLSGSTKAVKPTGETFTAYWLGATLHSLAGEEFSAFGTAKADGGVQLVDVAPTSNAAKMGFQKNDLVQSIDGKKIVTTSDLFAAWIGRIEAARKVGIVRNQKPQVIIANNAPLLLVETVDQPDQFNMIMLNDLRAGIITSNIVTKNDPLTMLSDRKLAKGYGPVFDNGITSCIYKMDLGAVEKINSLRSWSHNQNGTRGTQILTIYGSNAATDPGWNVADRSRFTAIGSIDTRSVTSKEFVAAAISDRAGAALGAYRWIVWAVSPVSADQENTAFQEFAVELCR
jgi:hypothetical protein